MGDLWQLLIQIFSGTLKFLYSFTHNYGCAIILLTVLVKIILHPFTHKQFKAMSDLQKLQPEMKKIQEKYKKNPQEMQKRIMALYKEHKMNPFSGCLPLLIQMPILIALYRAIMEFKSEFVMYSFLWEASFNTTPIKVFSDTSFLWIPSLLTADIPLLLLYTFSVYVSQKLTMMPSPDPQQQQTQKMMAIMMPIMFAFLFKDFPSAFILYWFIFNLFSTIHQMIIFPPKIHLRKAEEKKTSEEDKK